MELKERFLISGNLLLSLLFLVFISLYLKIFLEARLLPEANMTWKGWPGEVVLTLLVVVATYFPFTLSNYDITRQEGVEETLCPVSLTPVQTVLGYRPDRGWKYKE